MNRLSIIHLVLFLLSCEDKVEQSTPVDCAGIAGGTALLDECGICEGNNSSCTGCMNVSACNYDSSAIIDDGLCYYCNTLEKIIKSSGHRIEFRDEGFFSYYQDDTHTISMDSIVLSRKINYVTSVWIGFTNEEKFNEIQSFTNTNPMFNIYCENNPAFTNWDILSIELSDTTLEFESFADCSTDLDIVVNQILESLSNKVDSLINATVWDTCIADSGSNCSDRYAVNFQLCGDYLNYYSQECQENYEANIQNCEDILSEQLQYCQSIFEDCLSNCDNDTICMSQCETDNQNCTTFYENQFQLCLGDVGLGNQTCIEAYEDNYSSCVSEVNLEYQNCVILGEELCLNPSDILD